LKAEMGNAAGTPLLWLEEQTSQKLEEKLQSQYKAEKTPGLK